MESKRDYYEVLGVAKNADEATIKKAYRKLAKKYHPDTNNGDSKAEKMFKEVTEAYFVLSDPEKKKMYDQFGHAAFDQTGQAGGYQSGYQGFHDNGGNYQEFHFEGNMDDMGDIFDDMFKNMFHGNGNGSGRGFNGFTGNAQNGYGGFGSEAQSGFCGSNGGTRSSFRGYRSGNNQGSTSGFAGNSSFWDDGTIYSSRGEDLHAEVTIGFDDAVYGCDKVISLQDERGVRQSLKVHIPAGIDSGKSIRLRGKGMPGRGGENGDLLLKVNVERKAGIERKGMDVYTTVNIPYTTAVFGGEARVHTLYGDVVCKIKPGTQSGSKIRLKGKGIVSMKDSAVHGDHYVIVQIEVPTHLNAKARQKLMEYREAC